MVLQIAYCREGHKGESFVKTRKAERNSTEETVGKTKAGKGNGQNKKGRVGV